MSKDDKTIRVSLSVFSGRPDPHWQLKESEIEELKIKIKDLPETKMIQPPGLGYRGFRITNQDKALGIPERMYVYRNTISFTKDDKFVFYEDKNRIEEWLINQAIKQGYEKIVERIKSQENLKQ